MDILIRSAKAIGSVVGARKAAKWVRSKRIDHALSRVGLERSSSPLPTVGLVVLGALVGVGIALALAPSSGAELRTRLHHRLDDVKRSRFPSGMSARVS